MKKLLFVLALLVASSAVKTLEAQTGWVRQSNPLGDSTDLGKIQFVSSSEGWISASRGRLLHTTDAGTTWNTVIPFPNDTLNSSADPAITMSWVNQTHGWKMNWLGTGLGDAHGAMIHKTTDGGHTWQKKALIDSTATVSYSTADFQGTWQMHGLVSPDHGPSDHTGWAGWMHGTTTFDAGGNGTGSAVGSDGITRSNSGSMSISSSGVITVNGTTTYGFMSADKRTVVWTMTDGGGGFSLYVMQKEVSGTTYNTADFQGTWQMHGLVSPDHGPINTTGWGGWMHGTMSFDASGNGIGSAVGSDGITRSNSGSMSISSGGVTTIKGTDTYGFMSADKRTVVWTMTDGGGGFSLYVMQKDVSGTTYVTADLQGTWQMHGLVSPDHSLSGSTGWAGWMHGTMSFDASGNGTGSAVGSDGITRSNSGSMSISSGGVTTIKGTDTYGFMSADKRTIVWTMTDGGGGYSLYVMQKEGGSTANHEAGVQVQFVDENNGWATIYDFSNLVLKMLRTTDGGNNWTLLPSTGQVGCIFHFADVNTGWRLTLTPDPPYKIMKTTDGGHSWFEQYSFSKTTDDSSGFNALQFTDINHGWVVGDYGKILKTTDGGNNWTSITNTGISSDAKSKCIFFLNANTGWIGTNISSTGTTAGPQRVILHTTDGGLTWTLQYPALETSGTNTAAVFSIFFTNSNEGWFAADYIIGHTTTGGTPGVAGQHVSISSFTPTSGPIGTRVTITGTNFSTTPANNIVYFGAVRATVTSATSTSLAVTVPAGATYQPITVTVGGLTAYSSQPFIVTFPTVASITSASFASKVDFATGGGPIRVAFGDIDGDGKVDLIVANGGSNTVSVFRNTSSSGSVGAGSFAAKIDFATGSLPVLVAFGDLDGDGKPDLVVTNRYSNTVSVFKNTSSSGSITFASRVDFPTGVQPYGVAIGDIDGDGKPDLAVGNIDGTVSVFRNTGTTGSITSGSFASKVDFVAAADVDGVAIGDIDGDGRPDLVAVSRNYNIACVFRNTSTSGSITFAARVDFGTGMEPHGVAIGDLDGDGKLDLVVGNYKGKTVSVFRNTGSPGSITFTANAYPTAPSPLSVAIGDIDGDGKPDLVASGTDSAAVSVLRNTSSIGSITSSSFAPKVDFGTGVTPYYIATGDIDGDGKPELVSVNMTDNTISILQNLIQSPHAQATLAAVGPISAFKGTDVSLEIRVGDSTRAANVFGLGFDLLYTNTSYIDCVSADTAGCFLGGNLLYIVTPDDANGKVSVGMSRKAPLSGVSGGGTLIRLKFHVASTAPDTGRVTFSFANATANDQNGTSITLSPISGTTKIQGFSVWPGDADNNGVVNQSDILPLGLYWGSTGPARSSASLQWVAQSATAWTPQAATYADANGDGVVNQADVLPIGLNWGKTHGLGKMGSTIATGQTPTQASVQGTPILRATGPASVRGKTTFDVTVTLGDTANPVSGLFGISFVLDFAGSKSIIQATEVTAGTFIGNDIIFFPQIDAANGLVAVGMTRKSGASSVAGFGPVAKIRFQVMNNTSASSIAFSTRDISANDAGGNPVAVQPSSSSVLVSVSDINTVPTGYRLEQNYPNPFNPTTKIRYSVPNGGMVALRVYDILGKEVATLVDEAQTPGLYEVEFNARNLTSGVYYYRLTAGSFSETSKLVLIK